MEASALQASAHLRRNRLSLGASLLRLRSDEQLVALFREGYDDAFGIIHDRYRQRLFAYTRQMLPGSRQDAEDALQDIFVRAYSGLRANDRELALRAWLYRVAHNRCIDELRRPVLPIPEVLHLVRSQIRDPIAEAEQRESLRRLMSDVRRLPDQQRSALLMRELGGVTYADIAAALGISIPAVKSLLVRARVSLAQSAEARETACVEIREDLMIAHDRGVRPSGVARRHMHDCQGCRDFRLELRGISRDFAAMLPMLGPLSFVAKLVGLGSGAGGSAAAGSGAAAGGGAAAAGTGGLVASAGVLAAGAGHLATLLAATVVTAGGAVEVQHAITSGGAPRVSHHQAAVKLAPPIIGKPSAPGQPTSAAASYQPSAQASAPGSATPTGAGRYTRPASDITSGPTAGVLPTPPSGAEYLTPPSAGAGATGTPPGDGSTSTTGGGQPVAPSVGGAGGSGPSSGGQTGSTGSSNTTPGPGSGSTTGSNPAGSTGATTPSSAGTGGSTPGSSSSAGAVGSSGASQ